MKVFVTGCLHGEWDKLIDTVNALIEDGNKIELILVTGDCETFRNEEDMKSFTAPQKYHILGSFYKIYNGERSLPCLTIIIGGNHEASDLFHQLPFGGWVAPNCFYIGRAAHVIVGDILISGISGLYKESNYYDPVNEEFPLRKIGDMHSAYAFRAFSDFQLFGLKTTQIMLSHDWPSKIPLKFGGKYLQNRRPDLIESDKKISLDCQWV
ncbi:Lariat debranching enzyme-related protein [Trichomonas vaginalis G3]|uniref:Lariat debranching enzyme-related protein n=1 Tax=Trichomonas vaginalis (strain ATCC PRA-98 / G3) TaxID=412133 RepID=A2D8Y4_TRIV3|nr:Lariat debranching enzyme-related protein [Trichomonas vaginalis G3]|eukprot:XP_001583996.1 Lariat debranching enzyme-related protein [Trichomonas vaginalis G3]